MITPRLKQLLDSSGVFYRSIPHHTTYHADRTAMAAEVPRREFAKTVIVKVDGRECMIVVAADERLNFEDLRRALSAQSVELANEDEVRRAFPDCEVGAMPPFGELYGMEVLVSPRLQQDEEIAFNAGSHDEALHMHYRDYERLANAHLLQQ